MERKMLQRIEKLAQAHLETRVRFASIETKLDMFATKADLQEALHALTWKVLGSCALLVTAVYFVAKFVH